MSKRKAATAAALTAEKRVRSSPRLAAAATRSAAAAAAAAAASSSDVKHSVVAAAAAAAIATAKRPRGRAPKRAAAAAAASSSSAAADADGDADADGAEAPVPAAAAAAAGAGAAGASDGDGGDGSGMPADASTARTGTGPVLRWADVGNGGSAAAPASTYACTGTLRAFRATSKPVVALVKALQTALTEAADRAMGVRQSSYMRSLFPYHGLQQPARLRASKPVLTAHPLASEAHVIEAAKALWALPQREYQYCGIEVLNRHRALWSPALLPVVEELLRNKSWWDSVDPLSSDVVGALVARFPDALAPEMDRWLLHPYLWLRRSALLHQLKYKSQTDAQKLFRFVDSAKHESDFFVRKAIGWALREYSKTDPKAVRKYINANAQTLSALSVKEGGKYC